MQSSWTDWLRMRWKVVWGNTQVRFKNVGISMFLNLFFCAFWGVLGFWLTFDYLFKNLRILRIVLRSFLSVFRWREYKYSSSFWCRYGRADPAPLPVAFPFQTTGCNEYAGSHAKWSFWNQISWPAYSASHLGMSDYTNRSFCWGQSIVRGASYCIRASDSIQPAAYAIFLVRLTSHRPGWFSESTSLFLEWLLSDVLIHLRRPSLWCPTSLRWSRYLPTAMPITRSCARQWRPAVERKSPFLDCRNRPRTWKNVSTLPMYNNSTFAHRKRP